MKKEIVNVIYQMASYLIWEWILFEKPWPKGDPIGHVHSRNVYEKCCVSIWPKINEMLVFEAFQHKSPKWIGLLSRIEILSSCYSLATSSSILTIVWLIRIQFQMIFSSQWSFCFCNFSSFYFCIAHGTSYLSLSKIAYKKNIT